MNNLVTTETDENEHFHTIALDAFRQIGLDDQIIQTHVNLGDDTAQRILHVSLIANRLTQFLSGTTEDHEKIKDALKKIVQEKIDASRGQSRIKAQKQELMKVFSVHWDNNLSLLMAINQYATMDINTAVEKIQTQFSIADANKEELKKLIMNLRDYNEHAQEEKDRGAVTEERNAA